MKSKYNSMGFFGINDGNRFIERLKRLDIRYTVEYIGKVTLFIRWSL